MKLMKPFSAAVFWVILTLGVGLALLLLSFVGYREARAIKIIIALVVGSLLFWLRGLALRNHR